MPIYSSRVLEVCEGDPFIEREIRFRSTSTLSTVTITLWWTFTTGTDICTLDNLEVDPATALEVLKAGAAYSKVMDIKGGKMLSGDFTPEARLSQHLKDVRLILAAAGQCGAKVPLSEIHRALLEQAEAAGFGALDNSAVIKAFESV